jgi:hypothetical protein
MKPTNNENKQTNKQNCVANLDLIGASFFSSLRVWLVIEKLLRGFLMTFLSTFGWNDLCSFASWP